MKMNMMIVVVCVVVVGAMMSSGAYGGGIGKRGAMVGNYRPIKDVNDPHVQEIAKYAVDKHNQMDGTHLVYLKVVKGESQVVAGTNYRLQISAKDSSASRDYQAIVYERPWESYMNLTSFSPL